MVRNQSGYTEGKSVEYDTLLDDKSGEPAIVFIVGALNGIVSHSSSSAVLQLAGVVSNG